MVWKYTPRFIPAPAGERMNAITKTKGETGSSPRLRGTRNERPFGRVAVRFIPAPAGNARSVAMRSASAAVHPRACGERRNRIAVCCIVIGSSPRLRGTPPCLPVACDLSRFIPAPAGNASAARPRAPTAPVHPRACGERPSASAAPIEPRGSSPRLRGTRARHQRLAPRGGSSPRLRGTRSQQPRSEQSHRFIPAPAGNAPARRAGAPAPSVHPRACGERCCELIQAGCCGGSSPRLRGTPLLDTGEAGSLRFIPAPAGNAGARPSASPVRSVHPRACGERWQAWI